MELDFKKVLTDAITSNRISLDDLKNIFVEMIDDLKRNDKEMYDDITLKFYKNIYGTSITKECAEEIVSKMKPFGEKWNYDSIQPYNKGYEPNEFYLVMNMFYNDFSKLIGNDTTNYAKFTEAWFDDKDAKENKTFKYFIN